MANKLPTSMFSKGGPPTQPHLVAREVSTIGQKKHRRNKCAEDIAAQENRSALNQSKPGGFDVISQ